MQGWACVAESCGWASDGRESRRGAIKRLFLGKLLCAARDVCGLVRLLMELVCVREGWDSRHHESNGWTGVGRASLDFQRAGWVRTEEMVLAHAVA